VLVSRSAAKNQWEFNNGAVADQWGGRPEKRLTGRAVKGGLVRMGPQPLGTIDEYFLLAPI
jgi:hypothetical protein